MYVRVKQSDKFAGLGWDVVLFLALYIILPSYFAIELHEKLPLITASRALLVLMAVMLILRRRDLFGLGKFSLKKLNPGLSGDKMLRRGMMLYYVILLAVNATFLFETSESIKQIAVILAEEYALVWLLSLILDSRQKIVTAMEILLVASGVTGIVAAVSCVINENLFYNLYTVQRDMPLAEYYRLGMLRAEAGFSHPVYYGAYCAVMMPLGMYLVDHSAQRWKRLLYAGCISMDLVGLVLSNSRGSMLAFGCLAVIIFFVRAFAKDLKKLFATYIPIILVAVLILVAVAVSAPAGIHFLTGTLDSVVDIFFPDSTPGVSTPVDTGVDTLDPGDTVPEDALTDPTIPEETLPEYGENVNGLASRLDQLTGITYTMMHSPVFGLGPNAHARGLVGYMYYPGKWSYVKTVDMNIVAIISQYGLVGLLGFLSLYGSLGITMVRKKYRGDPLMFHLLLAFICYMLCLLSISFLDKWFWVLTAMIVSLTNVIQRENDGQK